MACTFITSGYLVKQQHEQAVVCFVSRESEVLRVRVGVCFPSVCLPSCLSFYRSIIYHAFVICFYLLVYKSICSLN